MIKLWPVTTVYLPPSISHFIAFVLSLYQVSRNRNIQNILNCDAIYRLFRVWGPTCSKFLRNLALWAESRNWIGLWVSFLWSPILLYSKCGQKDTHRLFSVKNANQSIKLIGFFFLGTDHPDQWFEMFYLLLEPYVVTWHHWPIRFKKNGYVQFPGSIFKW